MQDYRQDRRTGNHSSIVEISERQEPQLRWFRQSCPRRRAVETSCSGATGDHVAVASSHTESCSNHAWNSRRRSRDVSGHRRRGIPGSVPSARTRAGTARSRVGFARAIIERPSTRPAAHDPRVSSRSRLAWWRRHAGLRHARPRDR